MRRNIGFKALLFTAVLCLLPFSVFRGAEAAAKESGYGAAILSTTQFAAAEQKVSVLLEKPRDTADPGAWKKELRFFPFDAGSGLYATGEGEEIGEQAEFAGWEDSGGIYTVRLKAPGKYLLSGVPFYILDTGDERLAAVWTELTTDVQGLEDRTQQGLAKKVHDWMLKRVQSVIPEDRADLREACADPMNALLAGYACREAYAPLFQMLLGSVRIDAVTVTGTVNEEGHSWTLACLDGSWSFTDSALDDQKDKVVQKWFALDREQMDRDHVLSETSEAFYSGMVNVSRLDVFMAGDEELAARLRYPDAEDTVKYRWIKAEGKNWSLGPSEPVTIRSCYTYDRNEEDLAWDRKQREELSPKEYVRSRLVYSIFTWDDSMQAYDFLGNNQRFTTADDFELLEWSEDFSSVTVRFLTPGLYVMGGENFYVFDPESEKLSRIAADLDAALESCRRETQRETAKKMQDWVASRVSYNYELYRAYLKGAEYNPSQESDPVHTLLTGKTMCCGYATIFALLLSSADIPFVTVSGWAKGNEAVTHAWNALRLDGAWCYADPTYSDTGSTSSSKWFGLSYEQMSKDHIPEDTFLEEMILTGAYGMLLQRFHAAYTPRMAVPATLNPLAASASGFGFPKMPKFYRFGLDMSGEYYSFSPGTKVKYLFLEVLSSYGRNAEGMPSGYIDWPNRPFETNAKVSGSKIVRMTYCDYNPDNPFAKGTRKEQTIVVCGGTVDDEEYRLLELMPNKIPGWPECVRTWAWDGEGKPRYVSWKMQNDLESLEVAAYFDADGNTCAWALGRSAVRGRAVRWKISLDGELLELRAEQESGVLTLRDRTEDWRKNSSAAYLKNLTAKYPQLNPEDPLPEGVRLWSLSTNDSSLFGGPGCFATVDPLAIRNDDGELEINLGATDINGNPINLSAYTDNLSGCEMLTVR